MVYCIKRKVIVSNGQYRVIKINKLLIMIGGETRKHVINTYLEMKTPIVWGKFF